MKVVVTGNSGFIGSSLISHLCVDGVEAHSINLRFPQWREPYPDGHHIDMNEGAALIEILRSLDRSHARES